MQPSPPRSPLQPMTPLTPLTPLRPLQPLQPGTRQPTPAAVVGELQAPEPPPVPQESAQWSPPRAYQQRPPPPAPSPPPPAVGRSSIRLGRSPAGAKAAGVIGVAVALLVGLAAIGSRSSNGGQSVVISVPSISVSGIGSTNGVGKPVRHHSPQSIASIGQARTLAGSVSGQRLRVTLIRWVNNATSKDSFLGPGPGKRYVAAQFHLTNTGSLEYIDSPSNAAYVIDRTGRKYRSAFVVSGIRQGAVFDPAVSLDAGSSTRGFAVFEVPRHATIRKVEFSENSGFGQTGEWSFKR